MKPAPFDWYCNCMLKPRVLVGSPLCVALYTFRCTAVEVVYIAHPMFTPFSRESQLVSRLVVHALASFVRSSWVERYLRIK